MYELFETSSDSYVSEQEALVIINDYLPKLSSCITQAWDDWISILQAKTSECKSLSPTTKAGIVHDNIIRHARKIFGNNKPKIGVEESLGFFVVDFGKVIIRFKKLRHDLKPSNIPTKQQCLLNQQVFETEGIPWSSHNATLVTVGYRLNKLDELQDIWIVCWKGQYRLWAHSIPLSMSNHTSDNFNAIHDTPVIIRKKQPKIAK